MMKSPLFISLACAALASPVLADAPPHPFDAVDADRSGMLSKQEVIGTLPGLAAGFDIADANGDRALNRPEYEEAMALSAAMYGEGERSAHKREIFRSLDMNADRAISRTEARWRPEIADNFKLADRDGDGALGVSEFGLITVYTLATRDQAPAGASTAPSKPLDEKKPLDENPAVPGRTHEKFSFAELDVDDDGRIAPTEAAFREELSRNFAQADADRNGAVSRAEFHAWAQRR